MRSPRSVPFPALGLVLLLALSTACTAGDDGPEATRATPAVEQTKDSRSDDGPTESPEGGEASGGSATKVVDKDDRRTTSGTAPSYVEIESAEIEGGPDRLNLSMRLRGTVPERMPSQSILRVGFELTTKTGDEYRFDAQCLPDGWSTAATGGPEDFPSPGLEVDTERGQVTLQVDPAYMGGLQPFQWVSNVSWSGRDGDYAFDVAPTTGVARYP